MKKYIKTKKEGRRRKNSERRRKIQGRREGVEYT